MVLGFETEGPVHAFQTFPTELYSQPWICFCKTGVELRAYACWVESTTVPSPALLVLLHSQQEPAEDHSYPCLPCVQSETLVWILVTGRTGPAWLPTGLFASYSESLFALA